MLAREPPSPKSAASPPWASRLRRARSVEVADSPEARRLFPQLGDLLSVEACFVLFIFAGRYKSLPELRGFPIDFTLLFFVTTFCLIAWAVVSGRAKPLPLNLSVLLMFSFSALAAASVFWSSIDQRNIDKIWRFLLLTSTSFFAACMLAQDKGRRNRFIRMVACFSIAILAYYFYYRYLAGIDVSADAVQTGRVPADANNYIEYSAHAQILFIIFLALAVFGPLKWLGIAILGSSAALFALASIGGRGSLAAALLAIPLAALGGIFGVSSAFQRLTRLLVLISALASSAVIGYAFLAHLEGTTALWEELHTLDRYEMQLSSEHTDSMDERFEGQEFAFQQWERKPIFGWGIGEFRVQNSYLEYPHNLLLEIMMEIGLVGALLFFAVCAVAIVDSAYLARQGLLDWVDASIVMLFLAELASHLTVQGYLADDRYFLAYIGMVIGLGGAARRRQALSVHRTRCLRHR